MTGDAAAPLLRENSLAAAVALAASAGFLDAFAYLGHGNVFASFITGNIALLGMCLAGARPFALATVLPILAYAAGTALAQAMMGMRRTLGGRVHLLALASEVAVLAALAVLPHRLDDRLLVPLVTLTTAIQNTSFRALGARTFNSVFMTGNVQVLTGALATGLVPFCRAKLAEARDLGTVVVAFMGGAAGGALLTPRLALGALLAPAALLATLGLALTVPRPR